jgi:lysophospholipase L1-like esterase
MGSSFAAGPNIGESADTPPTRCGRSTGNYAHLLAGTLKLDLVDVGCNGARTTNILAPWQELPAQIDAVTPETKLVTVTVGGNDLNYMANIFAMACANLPPAQRTGMPGGGKCAAVALPTESDVLALAANLKTMIGRIRSQAPQARIVLMQYFKLLPAQGNCARTGLDDKQIATLRPIAAQLHATTAQVARETGVTLVPLDTHSRDHDICAAVPWINGVTPDAEARDGVLFHPNRAGMAAAATLIAQTLAALRH